MNVPNTYAEWVRCFDEMRDGVNDETVLSGMEKGTISWSSGVAQRFANQLYDLINFRLEKAAKTVQRNMDMARGNETAITNALLGLKREIKLLMRLSQLPALPEDKRSYLTSQITEYADNTQKALENSAKTDRSGKMSRIVIGTKVNVLN